LAARRATPPGRTPPCIARNAGRSPALPARAGAKPTLGQVPARDDFGNCGGLVRSDGPRVAKIVPSGRFASLNRDASFHRLGGSSPWAPHGADVESTAQRGRCLTGGALPRSAELGRVAQLVTMPRASGSQNPAAKPVWRRSPIRCPPNPIQPADQRDQQPEHRADERPRQVEPRELRQLGASRTSSRHLISRRRWLRPRVEAACDATRRSYVPRNGQLG
jgi:hypothetical protein